MPERTDVEVVSGFMEPRPSKPEYWQDAGTGSADAWWVVAHLGAGVLTWEPRQLTLDALHLVEARLTDEQWEAYVKILLQPVIHLSNPRVYWKRVLHASAADKLTALAAVIREAPNA